MIIWGGYDSAFFHDGARFNPIGNSWTMVTLTGSPSSRCEHTAVWTGTEMITWGGYNGSYYNDTFTYTPGRMLHLYQRP